MKFHICAVIAVCLFGFIQTASATTYFVDSDSGEDRNNGTSPSMAWKTIARVNTTRFSPGDSVLFKRNQRWRDTLNIPSSGKPGFPVTFSAYGEGKNPVIMRTDEFSDWKLLEEKGNNDTFAKIWVGQLSGVKNSWGMVKDNARVLVLEQYSKVDVHTIPDGYLYCPLNSGRCYFRNESGNPGAVEIGARMEAIRIENKHDIIIDGIDVFGPGGRSTSGSATGFTTVSIRGSSSDIAVKNMSISYGNSIGITADRTTHNISYTNLDVHDNGGTGIYMNAQHGSITRCKSYKNGQLKSDIGDRGGIGSFQGSDITVESNEVFLNGPTDGFADFEVSMVGTGPITIKNNYIHDCLQGCIQIAEGGDNSLIAYNIISRYGSIHSKQRSSGHLSGIRIGGGTSGSRGTRIYNNVIHGGQQPRSAYDAALYIGPYDNSGIMVSNNIFADNVNKDIFVLNNAKLGDGQFSHNLFSTISGKLNWKEPDAKNLKHWQAITRQGNSSLVGAPLFVNASGEFSSVLDFALQAQSPAIDKGALVGITRDYNGATVPFGAAPDIGAFEAHTNK